MENVPSTSGSRRRCAHPNDPEDSPSFAEYLRQLEADEEYAKWCSAKDSGAVIKLDDAGGEGSKSGFSSSYWDGDADDSGDNRGDGADSGPALDWSAFSC
jgi:hypothetical protein